MLWFLISGIPNHSSNPSPQTVLALCVCIHPHVDAQAAEMLRNLVTLLSGHCIISYRWLTSVRIRLFEKTRWHKDFVFFAVSFDCVFWVAVVMHAVIRWMLDLCLQAMSVFHVSVAL